MQNQKHILVIDNDQSRRHQIETVLAFVGENFKTCTEIEAEEHCSIFIDVKKERRRKGKK